MLSQKARYALKALFMLAARPTAEPVMIAEIAADAGVPRKFLEQILLELKKRGIVHSHRGKHGGYALGRSPDKISFAEVIRVIDGPLALSPCASVTAYRRCDDCIDEASCATRPPTFWRTARSRRRWRRPRRKSRNARRRARAVRSPHAPPFRKSERRPYFLSCWVTPLTPDFSSGVAPSFSSRSAVCFRNTRGT